MKKILGYSILTLLLLAALWTAAPAQLLNAITPALLQGRAWTFTALQKFSRPSGDPIGIVIDRDSQTVGAGVSTDYHLDNSAGTSTRYARVSGQIVDPTAGSEDGLLNFATRLNGLTGFKMQLDENGNLVMQEAGATVDGKNLDNAAMQDAANTFSPLQTLSGGLKRPTVLIKEVCPSGCEFTTVQGAIDAITDATSTKRYTVIIYPGDYDENVTAKSYVSIRGADRKSVRLRGGTIVTGRTLLITGDTTEVSVENLTIGGQKPIEFTGTPTGRTTTWITDAILGIVDGTEKAEQGKSQDGFLDSSSLRDIYMTNTQVESFWDCVRVNKNSTYRGTSNTLHVTNITTGAVPTCWYLAGPGAQIHEDGSLCHIEVTGSVSDAITVRGSFGLIVTTGATQATGIALNAVQTKIEGTSTTRTSPASCYTIGFTTTSNANGFFFDYAGATCAIKMADANSTIRGFDSANDTDLANQNAKWSGGFIRLSGGLTQNDGNQAVIAAGYTFTLTAVENGGSFAGAGVVTSGDARVGAFTTRLLGRTGDLVAAACTDKEIALDTAGATKEICICDGGAWACASATTITGPTD